MVVTTLEQSEKLLELGIDVSTADMAICNFGYMVRLLPIFDMDVKQYDYTPVWSLEALLELIPFDRDEDGNMHFNYKNIFLGWWQ